MMVFPRCCCFAFSILSTSASCQLLSQLRNANSFMLKETSLREFLCEEMEAPRVSDINKTQFIKSHTLARLINMVLIEDDPVLGTLLYIRMLVS